VVGNIRHAIAEEEEKFFGKSKASQEHHQQAAMDEHLEHLRSMDRAQRARIEEELLRASKDNDDNNKDTTSPAVEARKSFELNENNMGVANSHEPVGPGSWGWPGLGTYKDPEAGTEEKPESKPSSKPVSKHASVPTSPKVAARSGTPLAVIEQAEATALRNATGAAADADGYGWPGLGAIPTPK